MVYWEMQFSECWWPSANQEISDRRRFSTVTEAVKALVASRGGAARYRLLTDGGVPLFQVGMKMRFNRASETWVAHISMEAYGAQGQ
jgi:hypothetical protein